MAIHPNVTADLDRYMREALIDAALAGDAGEVPVGAVGIVDGEIVARAGNRRERDHDPTAHAELLVIRELAAARRNWRLLDATIVVTLEPCPMCAGSLWASRVGGLVFGAYDLRAGSTGSLYHLGTDPRLNHEYDTIGGVLAEECGTLLSTFFQAAR